MSSASDILDPVEAAQGEIDRSRRLIAETLEDLTRHHGWLETYHRAEKQRAMRLRRQEALDRLASRRHRALLVLRHFSAVSYAVARDVAGFLTTNGHALVGWGAPRAGRIAVLAYGSLGRSASRALTAAHFLSDKSFEMLKTGFQWSVRASEDAGIVLRRDLFAAATAFGRKGAHLAAPAAKRARIITIRARRQLNASSNAARARLESGLAGARIHPSQGRTLYKTAFRGEHMARLRWRRLGHQFQRHLAAAARPVEAVVRKQRRRMAVRLAKTARHLAALEGRISMGIIRGAPRLRRVLQVYAPQITAPGNGRALIVRPGSALVCATSGG